MHTPPPPYNPLRLKALNHSPSRTPRLPSLSKTAKASTAEGSKPRGRGPMPSMMEIEEEGRVVATSGTLRSCLTWPGKELRKQQAIALPLAALNLLWFTKTVITTAFLGHLGELQLAGGALGFTFANVTGFSVLVGLCGAMEPICGQAFGAGNRGLMRRTLLMATVLLLAASIPISFLWLNVDTVLSWFGQQSDIVAVSKTFVLYLVPDLAMTSFLCPLKAYLNSQGVTLPVLYSSAVGLALHVPINFVLVRARGFHGVAMAVWLTDLSLVIMLASYVLIAERRIMSGEGGGGGGDKARQPEEAGRWWLCCFDLQRYWTDWARLLRLSGPCCLSACLEWWCYEMLVMLTGRLPDARRMVSVITVVLNFDYLLFSVLLSLAICVSTRVSNELGAGKGAAARTSARVTLCLSIAVGCIGASAMAAAGSKWGTLFSHDRGVVHGVKKTMLLMALIEVVNSPLSVCGGIVRATARPQLGMYATLGGFYLVGLPLGILLAFKVKLGLGGLLLGFLLGTITSVSVLLVLVGRIDWLQEARNARELVCAEEEHKCGDVRDFGKTEINESS